MTRHDVAQKAPDAALSLIDFPVATTGTSATKYRAHSTEYGPWFFSSNGDGRFDLTGTRGTCYIADDPETAVREKLGETIVASQTLSRKVADGLTVSELEIPAADSFANIGDKMAVRFHVTSELSNMTDYTVTHAWAAAFAVAGHAGLYYSSRYTSDAQQNSWAVFGTAGPDDTRRIEKLAAITGRDACTDAGLTVHLPRPRRSATRTVAPPVT